MGGEFEIKILDHLLTMPTSLVISNSLTIRVVPVSESSINVYILLSSSKRILCFEISLQNSKIQSSNLAERTFQDNFDPVRKSLYKIINSPISIRELVISSQDLWFIGKEELFKIEFPHVSNCSNSCSKQDDFMDTSENNEFEVYNFESIINRDNLEAHNFHEYFFCQRSDLSDGFLVYYEDTKSLEWHVLLAVKNCSSVTSSSLKYIQLLSFPTFHKRINEAENSLKSDAEKLLKPEIIFFDSSNTFWNKLVDPELRPLINCICVVGHPEGKIMYSLCSWTSHNYCFKQILPFQQLYDIKQPVKNIYYADKIGESEELGFLIIIGKGGKLCFITTEKFADDDNCICETNGLWVLISQMPSPIQDIIFLSDCMIHCSPLGDMWVTKFVNDETTKKVGKYLKIATEATGFQNVINISHADKTKGVFLIMTKTSHIYLMECSKKTVTLRKSLPCLMNEVLQQSLSLKTLISIKQFQSKFFASLSTFASLKFKSINTFKLECSVIEIDGPPTKLLFTVDLKDYEHLNLDPDFWLISATLYNPFEMDTAIISKCKPFNLGQDVSMEIEMSTLCPYYNSPFPLYLEVGLVLNQPNYVATLDCSKQISKILPLYLRTHTLVISELYLLKNKIKSLKTHKFTGQPGIKNIAKTIAAENLENPLFRMFPMKLKRSYTVFTDYTLCLLQSTVEHMKSSESDAESSIFQIIIRKSSLNICDGTSLQCQNQPVSISISTKEGKIYINISSLSTTHLLSLKMAVSELLLGVKQDIGSSHEASCVCIPAKILRKCEIISKELLDMYGKDVNAPEFIDNAINSYCKLRKEVSEQLPF